MFKTNTTMEQKKCVYYCRHCGNVIEKVVDSGVPVICCGEPMAELTTDKVKKIG